MSVSAWEKTEETNKNFITKFYQAVLEYVLSVVLQHGDKEIY
jgi:hypothetical protein